MIAADAVAVVAFVATLTVTAVRLGQTDQAPPARVVAEAPRGSNATLVQNELPTVDDCRKRGITLRAGEGSCTLPDGTDITVEAPGDEVRLDGLGLRVRGVDVLDRLGERAAPLRPTTNGVFVRVRLALTNRLDGTVQFSNQQIALALGATTVLGPNSFATDTDPAALESRAGSVAPGRTVEGAVTFDVPRKLVSRYLDGGYAAVRIVTFGENMVSHGRTGMLRLAAAR